MSNKYLKLLQEVIQSTEEPLNKHSRVFVVDGLNTFIRSFAASPATNSDGVHVGGITGFLMSVGSAIKIINPTQVIIVFDGKNGTAKRKQIYPGYKANRKFKIRLNRSQGSEEQDNQLYQLMRLVDYLETLPFNVVTIDSTEADDVIAYVANEVYSKPENQVFIMSSDKDFFQLVNERIHIWSPTKKKLYFDADVVEELGVLPTNIALYKALIGDNSDNIPGVSGLGAKTLLKHLPNIKTVEMSLDDFLDYNRALSQSSKSTIHKKIMDSEDQIRIYYSIVQLSISDISTSSKLKIIDLLQSSTKKTNKVNFYKMLSEDGMTGTIKNPDMWLREVTQKLDMFLT